MTFSFAKILFNIGVLWLLKSIRIASFQKFSFHWMKNKNFRKVGTWISTNYKTAKKFWDVKDLPLELSFLKFNRIYLPQVRCSNRVRRPFHNLTLEEPSDLSNWHLLPYTPRFRDKEVLLPANPWLMYYSCTDITPVHQENYHHYLLLPTVKPYPAYIHFSFSLRIPAHPQKAYVTLKYCVLIILSIFITHAPHLYHCKCHSIIFVIHFCSGF